MRKPGQVLPLPRPQWFLSGSSGTLVTGAVGQPLIVPGLWFFPPSSAFPTPFRYSGPETYSSAPSAAAWGPLPCNAPAGEGTRRSAQELPRKWEGQTATPSAGRALACCTHTPRSTERESVPDAQGERHEQGECLLPQFFESNYQVVSDLTHSRELLLVGTTRESFHMRSTEIMQQNWKLSINMKICTTNVTLGFSDFLFSSICVACFLLSLNIS